MNDVNITSADKLFKNEHDPGKQNRLRDTKRLLESLSLKRDEEIEKIGNPRNSTLVKYNKCLAQHHLLNGDPGLSEKYILIAFGYLKASYKEAVGLFNPSKRNVAMNGISAEQLKLLNNLIETKLSFNIHISVDSLKEIQASTTALVVSNMIKDESQVWMIIIRNLSHKLSNELLDFVDEDSTSVFIEDELLPKLIIDDSDYRMIQMTRAKIYQSLVKKERRFAVSNPEIAENLAIYRHKSTEILHNIGEDRGAIGDLAEAYFFEILASKSVTSWQNKMEEHSSDFRKVLNTHLLKEWVILSYYAKSYVKGFNLAKKLTDKHEFISKAMDYAEQGRLSYTRFIKPYLYITELIIWLQKPGKISDVVYKVNSNHDVLINNTVNSDEECSSAVDLYSSVLSIIKNEDYIDNGFPLLLSANTLIRQGIIDTDNGKKNLVARILSSHINASIFLPGDEDNDGSDKQSANEIEKLETLLQNREGNNIEVKLSAEPQMARIAEIIFSFANTNGGKVIIGLIEKDYFPKEFPGFDIEKFLIISREFVLVGSRGLDSFRQKLASYIKCHADTQGRDIQDIYTPNIVNIKDVDLMVIEVAPIFRRYKRIIMLDGRVYARYDNQTSEMKPSEIVQKIYGTSTE